VQIHTSALLELALILFAITIVINAVARAMLWSVSRGMAQGVRE
jgi:ABC-type phosphate transport system permease subunit